MRRLVSLAGSLIILFTLLLVLHRLASYAQPLPTLSILFTNPDGSPCQQPCILGIRPGVADYDQVMAILKTHPLTRDYSLSPTNPADTFYHEFRLVGADVEVTLFARGSEPIDFFTLQFMPANWSAKQTAFVPPTIYSVIEAFGLPESVFLNSGATINLRYRSLLFINNVLTHESTRIDPLDPISLISVGRQPVTFSQLAFKWRGFIAFRRYLYDLNGS